MESKSKLKRDLSSKDIRIKRKAVRQLFEIGEVWILELFKTLLSDNDIWFQSKALNAYKEYATHKEHLHDLIQTKNESCQRVAADLLQRIPDESAAEILIKSQDSQTKKNAAKSLAKDVKWRQIFLEDESPVIRAVAIEHTEDDDILIETLDDEHPLPVISSIGEIKRKNLEINESTVKRLLQKDHERITASISDIILDSFPHLFRELIQSSNERILSDIATNIHGNSEFYSKVKEHAPLLLPRVLRNQNDTNALDFRLKCIFDEKIDPFIRAKLIEQFPHKKHEYSEKIEPLSTHDDDLIRITTNNLLDSFKTTSG
tara:strand:+ start:5144 stop:6094 length:951 start_codon:yes stop_codon:yes gene_type:complete